MRVGGELHAPSALLPVRKPGGLHGRSGRVRKISPPPGFDSRTFQPVTSCYTGYAILLHEYTKFTRSKNSVYIVYWQLAPSRSYDILGALAKLPKANISFVMFVRPRGTTRLPLDGFSLNLIFQYFTKICWEILYPSCVHICYIHLYHQLMHIR